MELYQDPAATPEENPPLYTVQDTVVTPDPTKEDYSVLKSITAVATQNNTRYETVNFESHVDDAWRKTVYENDLADRGAALNAASQGRPETVQKLFEQVNERNRLFGQVASGKADEVRAKLKELATTAAETVAVKNPAVLFNNSAEQIAASNASLASRLAATATLEKAIKDGKSIWNIAKGLVYEITPTAAFQGIAMDTVAVKAGVPEKYIKTLNGRSETKTLLQAVFQSLPDEKKGEWVTNLYTDLKDSLRISDWQAALMLQEVVTGAEQTWDGWSDWLDRLGVVGTALTGAGAVYKAGRLFGQAAAINNVERTLAAGGAKNAIVAAEAGQIASQVANKMRLQAVGVVAGELTGISTAIDLGKLISVNAAKVLPDVITTAADDLQRVIRAPVEKLIDELQNVIATKGVRAEEATTELAELRRVYSSANNPNVHSVDPFKLSEDGLVITGKVYYKPDNATSFLTKEAAEAYIKIADPTGKLGMKAVGDTTNTSFLVEETVKKDLLLRKTELETQILEAVNASKIKPPTLPRQPKPPASLVSSKPRWKTAELNFANNVDKATYQLTSKTGTSKSDAEVKAWLEKTTGWSDDEIIGHGDAVRKYIQNNETAVDASNVLRVESQVPTGLPNPKYQIDNDDYFQRLEADTTLLKVGNASVSPNTQQKYILNFVSTLGKALGMENRKLVVLQYSDLAKSKNPVFISLKSDIDKNYGSAAALHYNLGKDSLGNGQSLIVMKRDVSASDNIYYYMETFAHEYAHAFDAEFNGKYFATMQHAFNTWLKDKKLKYKGEGRHKKVLEAYPPEALLEYRALTMSNTDTTKLYITRYFNGDPAEYLKAEGDLHAWANDYGEFFAEQFAKWAFSDEVPTTILGQAFVKFVDGMKLIAAELNKYASLILGRTVDVAEANKDIAKMLKDHVKMVEKLAVKPKPSASASISEITSGTRTVESLEKELEQITNNLNAIDDAEKGLKTGYIVEQPINRVLDYSLVGKYTDQDLNSVARFAMGDKALSTSKELYGQRVVGIQAQSRYQKLLTNFVRPALEKLNKADMVALNDALVLGDKEGKVFQVTELAGMDLSSKAREAYYKVRALRDVMWQVRNDVAARSMTRRGFVELESNFKINGDGRIFVKPRVVNEGDVVFITDTNSSQRVTAEFLTESQSKGYVFYESVEPIEVGGKQRKVFAFRADSFTTSKIETVIPYRAGEYRRLYSDEYFVKFKSVFEVDGKLEEVAVTHRTASSAAEANAYVKAITEARMLHAKGALTIAEASRLMEPYGWKPEEIIDALDTNKFGQTFTAEVFYTRTDDDYVNEVIGMSSNYSSKRGDKVLSVFGKDTVNTLSPLDSVAAEIGNTAYVASVTEWRESHVVRWFNTFVDDLPLNVRTMTPDNAFRYMLTNKSMYAMYAGQSKRIATAEKVQDYIVSQMNISTKEEKNYLGFMRVISESIEGEGGSKPIMKLGAALRATKDYPTWARTLAFHSFFAFNPVQFFMQGMNAFNAVAISPLHGIKSAKSSALYAMALFSDQESVWQQVAKANNLTNLGLGMKEDEFVEVVRAIKRTGLLDGVNSTSLYGANTGTYGIFNKLTRRAGDISASPFNGGEAYSRLVSFDIARREFISTNPGKAWWTDDALSTIMQRQDDLTQNMTRANTASWQQGWKSIPTQFVQYQVKLLMNIVQSLLGNSRAFTRAEAVRLLITHHVVMGTAGSFLWPFRDLITSVVPEDMSETGKITVQQGVLSGAIAAITDGEAKLALGSRFNTFKYYEDIIKGLTDPEKSFMEVVAGPSGFAGLRLLGGVGEGIKIIVRAPMTPATLQLALTEMGTGAFSFLNNAQKARIAMANYNEVQSSAGAGMFRVTDTEAWLIGFGIPPVAQENYSIVYSSKKAHDDDIKSAAKELSRHAKLALTALNQNNTSMHETHAAVIQAILNKYRGSDYNELMSAAYKTADFTMYQKMLTDRALKEWKIKDLVTETQGN